MDAELMLEVNNEIDYFIIKATREWGLHHRKDVIMVNAQKIYEALEKQIPKKPTYEADGYANGELVYDTWYCPNCEKDYEVGYDDYDYCPCCGQRIDRSEVEE